MSFNYLYSDFDMQIALEFITLSFITINVILGYGKFEMYEVFMPALIFIEY